MRATREVVRNDQFDEEQRVLIVVVAVVMFLSVAGVAVLYRTLVEIALRIGLSDLTTGCVLTGLTWTT